MSKCHITSENIKTHVLEFTFGCKDHYMSNVYPDALKTYSSNMQLYCYNPFFSEKDRNQQSLDYFLFLSLFVYLFFWSAAAHLPCDLLRQSGLLKKERKVGAPPPAVKSYLVFVTKHLRKCLWRKFGHVEKNSQ